MTDSLCMCYIPSSLFQFHKTFLVPHSMAQCGPGRHLARGDVIKADSSLKIIIKWTKTLQTRDRIKCVDILCLGRSLIYQVKALFLLVPTGKISPLFQVKSKSSQILKSGTICRWSLKNWDCMGRVIHTIVCDDLENPMLLIIMLALQDIQTQSMWTSDAAWRYFIQDQNSPPKVSLAFQ